MKRSGLTVRLVSSLLSISGCAGHSAPSAEPGSELGSASELHVVDVTTVTTVQGSSGLFLSPRPSVSRPAYLEPGAAAPSVSFPATASDRDRAKLDTALLFRSDASVSKRWQLDASLVPNGEGGSLPSLESFFPKLNVDLASAAWPLELSAPSGLEADGSSEWTGWRAFPGLGVVDPARPAFAASAAALSYDTLGMSAPLVLASNGDTMIVTNRSDQPIANALLIYAHPAGVGVRLIPELQPGQQELTTTGPKEGPPATQLDQARQQLADFFATSLGGDLGTAIARAKSVPFLETQGLRLVYLLPSLNTPTRVTFSEDVAEHEQVVIAQAEVFLQTTEASVLSTLASSGTLNANSAASLLGRFTQAKLEYAAQSGDAQISEESSALLHELSSSASE